MIVDTIANARTYEGMSEGVAVGLRWLRETDLSALPTGRHDIDGDRVFVLVMETPTKPIEETFYEAHRRYADIQCIVKGRERHGWAPLAEMDPEPYDEEKDLQKLKGAGEFFTLSEGMFAIYFPHDAHMPGVAVGAPTQVRKVVVKVSVE